MNESIVEIGKYRCRVLFNIPSDKPSMVLLHGYSFTSEVWKDIGLLEKLEKEKIPYISIDMPYGSKSKCHPKTKDVNTNLILLDEILRKTIDTEKIIIIGASLGGYLAINYAVEKTPLGLILIAPVGTNDKKIIGKLMQLKIPVLVIYGENDTIVPKEEMEKFIETIPGGIFKIYELAGHPAYLYKKEEFIQDVLSFYKKII